ncbi:helix-turn-helix transcriptional regulator [Bordetella hinzii]|jgi:predicted ArsR family transcriptional regulator|uniref:Transcriptional regulator n=2 Tax=Bordetella hinzii TaxID=103855 RepID=A0AAN1RWW8_9BORD|nr:metalloregulator ArsR/SmtB family transcription factor [Bordetella hinzii]AKQ57045.1 MarR family protein [Bordetella hinzii]AKQ61511.1 MarR family protein [Bordetella hinzii]AZW17523.1 transcriptional regulator [Bordetella hinzii]KCB23841.1 MarR family protein [Bordetella hinzii OH87 BAL007II]KCB28225.1 MarR family protein [Bordetella hinzii L60]
MLDANHPIPYWSQPHQPADRVLMTLKTRGPQSVATIARVLSLTAEAVRLQVARLHEEGLVESETQSAGRGRPTQIWRLSAAGNARFPDTHAEMTVQMLHAVRLVFGEEGIDKLISAREDAMRSAYRKAMAGAADLHGRLRRLAELRSAEGYMAEVQPEGEGFLFLENHCPICSAAKACMGFCRSELELFRDVLGDQARVEREEHILAGARRCAYRVLPA